jgi:hypothetical protein
MLQGVTARAQKCRNTSAPNFYRVTKAPRTASSALHPKGAIMPMQQCQFYDAPNFLRGAITRAQRCRKPAALKGRATRMSQKCQTAYALSNQFNGVIVKTQKCRDIVAPRGEPTNYRRDASMVALSPTSLTGTQT